jgi:hypothetical protein
VSHIQTTPLASQVKLHEQVIGLAVPEIITREWIARAACTLANAILARPSMAASYGKALYALQLALAAIGGKQGGRPPKLEVSNAKQAK